MHHHRRPTVLGSVASALLATAVVTTAAAIPATAKVAPPKISGAWARTSPAMVKAGAAYFTLTSAAGDRLLGVRVSSKVAATAELHETVMGGASGSMPGGVAASTAVSGATASTAAGPMGADPSPSTSGAPSSTRPMAMTMRPVEAIELPARTPVALQPGGLHVMLMGLKAPLRAGSVVTITLRFAKAGAVAVRVPVRDSAP